MGRLFLILIALIIVLVIDYLIAREFYRAAELKGYPQQKYLWICFFFGIAGYLLVIALPTSGSAPRSDELPDI